LTALGYKVHLEEAAAGLRDYSFQGSDMKEGASICGRRGSPMEFQTGIVPCGAREKCRQWLECAGPEGQGSDETDWGRSCRPPRQSSDRGIAGSGHTGSGRLEAQEERAFDKDSTSLLMIRWRALKMFARFNLRLRSRRR
jgi:hypothetical protein